MVSSRKKAVPERETDKQAPLYIIRNPSEAMRCLCLLRGTDFYFSRLPSFAHRLHQNLDGAGTGRRSPSDHSPRLGPARASLNPRHWLAGFLGRVAVGHRSGPLLDGPTAHWAQSRRLLPSWPSRLGWAGLWCVGPPSTLALSHTLLLVLLIPDRITGALWMCEMRAPILGLALEWAMACGLR